MEKKTKHFILAFFSLILLGATLFIDTESKNQEELKNIRLGRPFSFIVQDHSAYYSFSYFPTWDKFNFRDWKSAKDFSFFNFFASFLSIFLALEIIIYLLESFDFWIRKKFSKKEEDMIELGKEK